mmetsp:Transcript_38495/g.89077  ORF Transcript_38495/g.89077 Transcript_38495/m.89077 type:complete len:260 (-) Transcript_38495:1915-2694(-)
MLPPTVACPTTRTGHISRSFKAWAGMLQAGVPGPSLPGQRALLPAVDLKGGERSVKNSGTALMWWCWKGLVPRRPRLLHPPPRPLQSPQYLQPPPRRLVRAQPCMNSAEGITTLATRAVNQAPIANSPTSGTLSACLALIPTPQHPHQRLCRLPRRCQLQRVQQPPGGQASAHVCAALPGMDPSISLPHRWEAMRTSAARTLEVPGPTFQEAAAAELPGDGVGASPAKVVSTASVQTAGRSVCHLRRVWGKHPTGLLHT